MTRCHHRDEARERVQQLLRDLGGHPEVRKATVVEDLFGTFDLIVWTTDVCSPSLRSRLLEFSKEIEPFSAYDETPTIIEPQSDKDIEEIYEQVWDDGFPFERAASLRWVDRYRTLGGWLTPLREPPWRTEDGPPIVVFYSFKGGVGRTTALVAFALQRAEMGDRVVAIDLDLDAPGAGTLLDAEMPELRSRYGVVDYLLEKPLLGSTIDLTDYTHVCRPPTLEGQGELRVLPAGVLDGEYTRKLSRVDLEPSEEETPSMIETLLADVRNQLRPDWILLDSRAGLSNPAGPLVSGLAHLHVTFASSDEQSWQGLKIILSRLAQHWVEEGRRQGDCVLVQSKVPGISAKSIKQEFEERALELFEQTYYASNESLSDAAEDVPYDLGDTQSSDAPHVPCPLDYTESLAVLDNLEDVADLLLHGKDYDALGERIAGRFLDAEPEEEPDASRS